MLQVGFGRVDITPELGFLLIGRQVPTPSAGVQGPLHGRVLLADDGTQRVAIVSLDVMALPANEVSTLRARLAGIGGLAPGAILIACAHIHSAPVTHLVGIAPEEEVFRFLDYLQDRLAEAMTAAVTDLQPAELMGGRVHAPGWAFNRRPIYANNQVATHGFTWAAGFQGMEDTPDEELQLLHVRRPDGSTAGGLVSFACHPTVMEDAPVYSSDYVGVLVSELEQRYGGTFNFIQGASADTANLDPSSTEPDKYFGWAYAQRMGKALADLAEQALASGYPVASGQVQHAATRLRLAQRRPTPEQVKLARWYLEEAGDDIDEISFTRQFHGYDYTFFEVPHRANERHVRELLGMWEWQRRAGTRELIEDVEVQVVMLGDVAIVAYPVELFAAFGRIVKRESPYPETFVATLSNGWYGYVPTSDAFARGGYEPTLAYKSRLVPEAGEQMNIAALHLLRGIARVA